MCNVVVGEKKEGCKALNTVGVNAAEPMCRVGIVVRTLVARLKASHHSAFDVSGTDIAPLPL